MYTPGKLYGFARSAAGHEVFFHREVFRSGAEGEAPAPIVGERVQVEYDPHAAAVPGKPPRAVKVERLDPAVLLFGEVEQFDPGKGWGFLKADDGVSYYLHRSEVLDGRLPLPGSRVSFYGGSRQNRPRACYVTVL